MATRRSFLQASGAAVAALAWADRSAYATNAPGITDAEIKFG